MTAKQRALVQQRKERELDKAYNEGFKAGKDTAPSWPTGSMGARPPLTSKTVMKGSFSDSDDSDLYGYVSCGSPNCRSGHMGGRISVRK